MGLDILYNSARPSADGQPRICERIAREGPATLSDTELPAALLGTGMRGKGVHDLASEELELLVAGGLPEADALALIPGIGGAPGQRRLRSPGQKIASPGDVWPIVSHWSDRIQERFICCALNGAHELIAVGLVNRMVVDPSNTKYYWDFFRIKAPMGSGKSH